ncbi:MAG: lipase family protein, partial [Planctomycetales bacterium]
LADYIYPGKLGGVTNEEDRTRLRDRMLQWGFDRAEFIDQETLVCDTQVAVISSDDLVVVVYRGTESKIEGVTLDLVDWLSDAGFSLVPPKADLSWGDVKIGVHRGFITAHHSVRNAVVGMVQNHLQSGDSPAGGKKVWVTGHSLGGALASLSAYQLQRIDDIPVQGVVTFGSPRVGNGTWNTSFTAQFGGRAQRWIQYNDLIPMLPPEGSEHTSVTSYRHVGVVNTIGSDGQVEFGGGEQIATPSISSHLKYCSSIYNAGNFPDSLEMLPEPLPGS